MRLIPTAPVRTLEECAREMGITLEQAYYLHGTAIQKIKPALIAYGYKWGDR